MKKWLHYNYIYHRQIRDIPIHIIFSTARISRWLYDNLINHVLYFSTRSGRSNYSLWWPLTPYNDIYFVVIATDNSLLSYYTNQLPEPMLTYHQSYSGEFTWEQFHTKWSWTWYATCIRVLLRHLPGVNDLNRPQRTAVSQWALATRVGPGAGVCDFCSGRCCPLVAMYFFLSQLLEVLHQI